MNPIKVIAVTSGKGGVGKTNVSVNLGVALCRIGRRVTLLDADLGLANVDVLLGLKPRRNLKDVLSGETRLADVVVPGPRGLKIVPAASGTQEMVHLGPREHAGIIGAFSEIAHQMDVLIVDTAAGISNEVVSFLLAAQEIVVVVCNEPTSITDAYALIKVLNQSYDVQRVRVLANMVRSPQEGSQVFAKLMTVTDRFLDIGLDYIGVIHYDEHVRRAVQRQRSVVDIYPTSPASQNFMELARRIDRWQAPRQPRGHLEFFIERLLTPISAAG
jgi:flagellar biosynthesis protein FlhG